MSVYNGERFLSSAIQSILAQTYKNIEFIIVNDGSTDRSREIILGHQQDDPRIKLLDNEKNSGLIYSLNKGLAASSGKYIARMDADDLSLPTRFAKQVHYMERNPDVGALGVRTYEGLLSRMINATYTPGKIQCKYALLFYNCIGHPGVMLRKATLEEHHLNYSSDYLYAEDFKLWTEISNVSSIDLISDPLLYYRPHANQVSKTHISSQLKTHSVIVSEQFQFHFNENIPPLGSGEHTFFPNEWLKQIIDATAKHINELQKSEQIAITRGLHELTAKGGIHFFFYVAKKLGKLSIARGRWLGLRFLSRSIIWSLKRKKSCSKQ